MNRSASLTRLILLAAAALPLAGCPDDPVSPADGSSGSDDSSGTTTAPMTTTDPDTTDDGVDTTAGTTAGTTVGTTMGDDTTTTGVSSSDGASESSSSGDPSACIQITLPAGDLVGEVSPDQAGYRQTVDFGFGPLADRLLVIFSVDDTGTIELGQAPNDVVETCEQCVVMYAELDPAVGFAQTFFADMGQLEIDAATPPLTTPEGFTANLVGVRLIEVDGESLEPIEDGDCVEIQDTTITGVTSIADWSCNVIYYDEADGCDCGCGIIDPDCPDALSTSCEYCDDGSCAAGGSFACVDELLDPNDNAVCDFSSLWTCDAALYDAGDGICDCGCTVVDPDCADATVASCDSCNGIGSCAEGELDCGSITPEDSGTCVPAPGWTCNPAYYDAADGCDCGCGVVDPDCPDALATSCEFCDDSSCAAGGMFACIEPLLVPDNNALCDPAGLWTCDAALYGAGDGICDCGCGVVDPDCADATAASCNSCNGVGSCAEGELDCSTITPTDSGTCVPVIGWTCNPAYYDAADGCDCGCGVFDLDCADMTVGACEFCGNPGACTALGSMCPSIVDPIDNAVCDPGAAWTCDLALYDAGNGVCNCGCGVPDPDCEGPQAIFCDVCDDVGSCGEGMGGCAVTPDPNENYLCI